MTRTTPLGPRFWAKVDKSGDCWLWLGAMKPNGYGNASYGPGRFTQAHRVAYLLERGALPPVGKEIDHLCRNRRCVRPDHLDVVTRSENQRRIPATPNCKRGHPRDRFTYTYPTGGRHYCRECGRTWKSRRALNVAAARAPERGLP